MVIHRIRLAFFIRRSNNRLSILRGAPFPTTNTTAIITNLIQHLLPRCLHPLQHLGKNTHQLPKLPLVQFMRRKPRPLVVHCKLRPDLSRLDNLQRSQMLQILPHTHRRRPLQNFHHARIRNRLLISCFPRGCEERIRRRKRHSFGLD